MTNTESPAPAATDAQLLDAIDRGVAAGDLAVAFVDGEPTAVEPAHIVELVGNVETAAERLRIAREERDHEDQITGLRHELQDARDELATARAELASGGAYVPAEAPADELPAIGTRVKLIRGGGRGTVSKHLRLPFTSTMAAYVRDDANGVEGWPYAGRWVPLTADEEEAKRAADAAAIATAYAAPATSCGVCGEVVAVDGTCGAYCPEADLVEVQDVADEPAEEPAPAGPMVMVPAAELERLQAIEAAALALVEVVIERTAQGWRKTPMPAVRAIAEALGG